MPTGPGARTDTLLLCRLGEELGDIYRHTLDAPLPRGLQSVLDRMEMTIEALGRGELQER